MSSEIKVDTISENTSANGVVIDGLTIKDGGITATTGATVFNEGSSNIDFRVESNGNANMLVVDASEDKVGIGIAVPEQLLHIHGNDSGSSYSADGADKLIIEHNDSLRIDMRTPASNTVGIMFSDTTRSQGSIQFSHANNQMTFSSNAGTTNGLHVYEGAIGSNEAAPDVSTGGLCLNQSADDDKILTMKSSDVAHGVTDNFQTDTYGTLFKQNSTAGGLRVTGISEGQVALMPKGVYTTGNTAKNTGALAPIFTDARKKSGTGETDPASNENLFCVTGGFATKFIVDMDGDIHYDGSDQGAYDSYDDAHLVRAFDQTMNSKAIIQGEFDKFVQYNRKDLVEAGLVGDVTQEEKDKGIKPHICLTGMQRLHNGAIWQQYEKTERLTNAMYELAKAAVGEDKANEILEQNDIKLLN